MRNINSIAIRREISARTQKTIAQQTQTSKEVNTTKLALLVVGIMTIVAIILNQFGLIVN